MSHANPVGKIITKDIYIIKNDINSKIYIGQSVDAKVRFKTHCSSPDKTSLIDAAIKKYGKEHFSYEILESQIENYNEREQYWIRYYGCQTPFGYNITPGGQPAGNDCPATKISDEEVISLKEDLRNTSLPLSEIAKKYNISKKQVLRINQGISRASLEETYPIRKTPNINGKLTEEDVDSIFELLKYTYRTHGDIANEFGVTAQTIKDIDIGKYHIRENEKYPVRTWKSSGTACFTYEQVTEVIDLLLKTDLTIAAISKKYNVNRSVIVGICRGTIKRYRREYINYPLRRV